MNTFNFNGTDLRTIEIEGEPWFHAADACRCLGLNVSKGTSKYMGALNSSEGRITPVSFGGKGGANAGIITESGLYKLIMRAQRSRSGVAEFQDWVTKEVLPSIRKTGGYLLNEEARTTAHADTRSAMPLPEAFQQVFDHFMKPIVDKIDEQNAVIVSLKEHIEKLASGESPDDIWLSGDLVRDMSDQHIRNAIRWAKKNATDYSVLTREQARRIRLKKAA